MRGHKDEDEGAAQEHCCLEIKRKSTLSWVKKKNQVIFTLELVYCVLWSLSGE